MAGYACEEVYETFHSGAEVQIPRIFLRARVFVVTPPSGRLFGVSKKSAPLIFLQAVSGVNPGIRTRLFASFDCIVHIESGRESRQYRITDTLRRYYLVSTTIL